MSRQNNIYGYYVNLDERGSFYADVRDAAGQTVFEIRADGEEIDLVDAGYMRHKTDVDGLAEHLRALEIIPQDAEVLGSRDFEERLEQADEDEPEI